MRREGFTLVEILIVVVVMLILGRAVYGGAGRVLRTLRFNNAFNRLVLVTQEARNLAVTSKSQQGVITVTQYVVTLNKVTNVVTLFADDGNGVVNPGEQLQSFPLTTNNSMSLIGDNTAGGTCTNQVTMIFALPEGRTRLICGVAAVPQLTIGTRETGANGTQRTFTIHQESGIPQI